MNKYFKYYEIMQLNYSEIKIHSVSVANIAARLEGFDSSISFIENAIAGWLIDKPLFYTLI